MGIGAPKNRMHFDVRLLSREGRNEVALLGVGYKRSLSRGNPTPCLVHPWMYSFDFESGDIEFERPCVKDFVANSKAMETTLFWSRHLFGFLIIFYIANASDKRSSATERFGFLTRQRHSESLFLKCD